jgi:WD40 repeat protein
MSTVWVRVRTFTPANSPLSRKISAWFPKILHVASGHDMNWLAVQTVLRGHTNLVKLVSFSPDDIHIVTGSGDKTVWLWDAAMGQPGLLRLTKHCDCQVVVSRKKNKVSEHVH